MNRIVEECRKSLNSGQKSDFQPRPRPVALAFKGVCTPLPVFGLPGGAENRRTAALHPCTGVSSLFCASGQFLSLTFPPQRKTDGLLQLAHRLFCDWQNLGEEGHDHVERIGTHPWI